MLSFRRFFLALESQRRLSARRGRPLQLESLESRALPSSFMAAHVHQPEHMEGQMLSDQSRSISIGGRQPHSLDLGHFGQRDRPFASAVPIDFGRPAPFEQTFATIVVDQPGWTSVFRPGASLIMVLPDRASRPAFRETGPTLLSRGYGSYTVFGSPVLLEAIQFVVNTASLTAPPAVAVAVASTNRANDGVNRSERRSQESRIDIVPQTVPFPSNAASTVDPSMVPAGVAGETRSIVVGEGNASGSVMLVSAVGRPAASHSTRVQDHLAVAPSVARPLHVKLTDYVREAVARTGFATERASLRDQWDGLRVAPAGTFTTPAALASVALVKQSLSVELQFERSLSLPPIDCGLLSNAVAVDTASLELDIQNLLERVEDLGQSVVDTVTNVNLPTCLTVFAVSAALAEVVRLQLRRARARSAFAIGPNGEPESDGCHPGHRPTEELP